MRLVLIGLAGFLVIAAVLWAAREQPPSAPPEAAAPAVAPATPTAPPVALAPPAPLASPPTPPVAAEAPPAAEPAPPTAAVATPAPAPAEPPRASVPAPAPAAVPAAPPTAPPAHASPAPAPAAEPPPPRRPSFDVVRIGSRGDAVIAGRAEPGAEVIVLDGSREIGRARADRRGEWVLVPAASMAPGARELSLRALNADGSTTESESTVVLVVPEPQRDIAGQPSGGPSAPLAVLAPREAHGELRVLQAPPPPVASPAQVQGNAPQGNAPAAPAVPQGRPPGGVSVDVVDYGETGTVQFAGRASPGGAVRLYLDNRHIGDAAADAEGRWMLRPDEQIAPGTFDLRADQVDRTGRVTARVQLPFQRAATPPQALGERSIVVQPGNNLWQIARQTYGRGVHYIHIHAANTAQIRDPNLIFPGQVFTLPAEVPPAR